MIGQQQPSPAPDDLAFKLMPALCADSPERPRRAPLYWDNHCNPELIEAFAREQINYPIVPPIYHKRILSSDYSYGALVVVHNLSKTDDAELLALFLHGMPVSKTLVRAIAYWIFREINLRRITMRIRGDDFKARDYARRLGFRPEGVQRRWFANDLDAHLWGMLRSECRWI